MCLFVWFQKITSLLIGCCFSEFWIPQFLCYELVDAMFQTIKPGLVKFLKKWSHYTEIKNWRLKVKSACNWRKIDSNKVAKENKN